MLTFLALPILSTSVAAAAIAQRDGLIAHFSLRSVANGETMLAPPVSIGTPPKWLDSLELVISGDPNKHQIIAARSVYDGAASTSAVPEGQVEAATMSWNGTLMRRAEGDAYQDMVSLGEGLPATKMGTGRLHAWMLLTQVSVNGTHAWRGTQGRLDLFGYQVRDAAKNWTEPAVGMWFAQPPHNAELLPWDTIESEEQVAAMVKSATPNAGGLTYGGVEEQRFHGPLVPVPNDGKRVFGGMALNGSAIEVPSNLTISTPGVRVQLNGVTYLLTTIGKALLKALGGEEFAVSDLSRWTLYTLPCDIKGTVSLNIGGTVLNASRLLYAKTDDGKCISSFFVWKTWKEIDEAWRKLTNDTLTPPSSTFPEGEPPFDLGLNFLRSVYTKMTFNTSDAGVPFASFAFAPVNPPTNATSNASSATGASPKNDAARTSSAGAAVGLAGILAGLLATVL